MQAVKFFQTGADIASLLMSILSKFAAFAKRPFRECFLLSLITIIPLFQKRRGTTSCRAIFRAK
jgi:hypothetical protein